MRPIQWISATAAGGVAAFWLEADLWRLVASCAALALLTVRRLPGTSAPPSLRRARDRWLLLLAIASAAQATAPDLWRFASSPWVRVWNVYHYYLGSKYFPELGYHDLYAATLKADEDDRNYWRSIRKVRDLQTYEVVSRRRAVAGYDPREHFSPERWQDFRRDVRALQVQRPPGSWSGIFRDRGYNPTPLWTAAGRLLTPLPADHLWTLKILCSLDLLLLAGTFLLIRRTFGTRALAGALLFLTLSPVNEGRLVGGLLQYDWFCAVAAGLCFLRRGRAWPAGTALVYAVGTRVFPVFLLISAAVPRVLRWIRSGSVARWERHTLAALAVAGALALGAGALAGGATSWSDFAGNVGHHAEAHTFGQKRLGLAHVFTRDVRDLDIREPREKVRRELFERQKSLRLAAGLTLLVLWGAAVLRRSPVDGALLGLLLFFVLTVSSRYYGSLLALLPLLARPGPAGRRRVRRLSAAQAGLFAILAVLGLRGFDDFAFYNAFNLALVLFWLVVLASFLLRDLRVWRRFHRDQPVADL